MNVVSQLARVKRTGPVLPWQPAAPWGQGFPPLLSPEVSMMTEKHERRVSDVLLSSLRK